MNQYMQQQQQQQVPGGGDGSNLNPYVQHLPQQQDQQQQQQQQGINLNQYATVMSQFPYYGAMMGQMGAAAAFGGMMNTDQQQQMDPNTANNIQQQQFDFMNNAAAFGMDPNNMLALQQLLASQQTAAGRQQQQQQQAVMNPWLAAYGQVQPSMVPTPSTSNIQNVAGIQTLAQIGESMAPPFKINHVAKKKPKNKPKRPLSAYNVFFKEERERILQEIPNGHDYVEQEEPNDKKRKALPHGKIGFESLARTIGKRWKALNDEDLVYYKEKAQVDMERYKKEMETFMTRQREAAEASMLTFMKAQQQVQDPVGGEAITVIGELDTAVASGYQSDNEGNEEAAVTSQSVTASAGAANAPVQDPQDSNVEASDKGEDEQKQKEADC
jgi:hypothetical protein